MGGSIGDLKNSDDNNLLEVANFEHSDMNFLGEEGYPNHMLIDWDNMTKINLNLLCDDLADYLPELHNCDTLRVRSKFGAVADDIFEHMKSVRSFLYIGPITFTSNTFNLLQQKIDAGDGVENINFMNSTLHVPGEEFVNFLSTIKLAEETRNVVIKGFAIDLTHKEFKNSIEKTDNLHWIQPQWNSRSQIITRNNAHIELIIGYKKKYNRFQESFENQ